jgi:hypothetical protein
MSPFISVSRRARRRPSPPVLAVAIVTGLLLASIASPALAGPSALAIAKKALQVANKAEKDAKKSTVGASRLVNGAVTTPKIANGAVTGIKIAPGSVANATLADNSVGNAKLIDTSVGTAKLADGAVTSAKLAPSSVSHANIVPGSLTLADIKGADASGPINVTAGIVSGNCAFFDADVAGAVAGQVPLIALAAGETLNNSFIMTALKVPTANKVTVRFCWIGGGTSPAITNTQVRVVTFG